MGGPACSPRRSAGSSGAACPGRRSSVSPSGPVMSEARTAGGQASVRRYRRNEAVFVDPHGPKSVAWAVGLAGKGFQPVAIFDNWPHKGMIRLEEALLSCAEEAARVKIPSPRPSGLCSPGPLARSEGGCSPPSSSTTDVSPPPRTSLRRGPSGDGGRPSRGAHGDRLRLHEVRGGGGALRDPGSFPGCGVRPKRDRDHSSGVVFFRAGSIPAARASSRWSRATRSIWPLAANRS